MTQHSSENLMERARLTDREIRQAHDAWIDDKRSAFKYNWEHAIAHAQRVKMAQEVVAWLRERAHWYEGWGANGKEAGSTCRMAADALEAQLEAETGGGKSLAKVTQNAKKDLADKAEQERLKLSKGLPQVTGRLNEIVKDLRYSDEFVGNYLRFIWDAQDGDVK